MLAAFLYLLGEITRHIAGRRVLAWGEAVIARLPVVKTLYSATKQVMDSLSLSGQQGFKTVVWIEFPRPGLLTIGFVTGKLVSADGRPYYKILVPTAPNPMSGFLELAPCDEVTDADIQVDDAIKMLVSGGILSPPELRLPSRASRQEQTGERNEAE